MQGQTVGEGFDQIGAASTRWSPPGSSHAHSTTEGTTDGLRIRRTHRGAARAACSPSWTSTSTRPSRSSTSSSARSTTAGPGPTVAGPRGAAGRGPRPRAVEPLPARRAPDGAGLTNLQYAPLAEITGRSRPPRARRAQLRGAGHRQHGGAGAVRHRRAEGAVAASRCSTAEIRSAFAMTEPDVASSDATNIATRIERDGDEYVINGRKWWITGAMNPQRRDLHRDGQDRPDAPTGTASRAMILVPRDTPGVEVIRGMTVFGYDDHDHGGHAELRVRRRAGAGREPDRRGGRRLRHRPGPARPRPDPPLHALDRHGRARPSS